MPCPLRRECLLGQRLLALPDNRDFRNRVDAVGQQVWNALGLFPEGMEVGDPALLHRSGRQAGKSDGVADGVDMVHFRLKILVHGNQFTIADGQAGFLKVQATRRPGPADVVQRAFRLDLLAGCQA